MSSSFFRVDRMLGSTPVKPTLEKREQNLGGAGECFFRAAFAAMLDAHKQGEPLYTPGTFTFIRYFIENCPPEYNLDGLDMSEEDEEKRKRVFLEVMNRLMTQNMNQMVVDGAAALRSAVVSYMQGQPLFQQISEILSGDKSYEETTLEALAKSDTFANGMVIGAFVNLTGISLHVRHTEADKVLPSTIKFDAEKSAVKTVLELKLHNEHYTAMVHNPDMFASTRSLPPAVAIPPIKGYFDHLPTLQIDRDIAKTYQTTFGQLQALKATGEYKESILVKALMKMYIAGVGQGAVTREYFAGYVGCPDLNARVDAPRNPEVSKVLFERLQKGQSVAVEGDTQSTLFIDLSHAIARAASLGMLDFAKEFDAALDAVTRSERTSSIRMPGG